MLDRTPDYKRSRGVSILFLYIDFSWLKSWTKDRAELAAEHAI